LLPETLLCCTATPPQKDIVLRARMWAYGCEFPAFNLDIYSLAEEEYLHNI